MSESAAGDALAAPTKNEANLQQALEAWNAGHLEGYLRLYDDSIKLHGYSTERR